MHELRAKVVKAIQRVRQRIAWKPGKATEHLAKRIDRGHLSLGTTLAEYGSFILGVVNNPGAEVYTYSRDREYPAVVAQIGTEPWLVMFSMDGVMETAFAIDEPHYLDNPRFTKLGTIEELEAS